MLITMDATHVFFTLLYLFNLCYSTKSSLTQTIILEQGFLRGLKNLSQTYEAYLGIPYASVAERYREAKKAPSWNGTLIASNGNIQCYQFSKSENKPVGQKDCLVLNIFKPIRPLSCNLLPVMVFIPGGGLFGGSNSYNNYDPEYFVEKGVTIVTINYRVGAFGFLCLNGTDAHGNIGLKDQLLALKWIKNNINAFGGDPNLITVFGESAGSASLHYLILTKRYKNLFNRAILQSGSALQATMFDNNPIKTASFVASRMGYNTSDAEELLSIFEKATTDEIIKATHIVRQNNPFGQYLFRPCVENSNLVESSLITATPRQLLKAFNNDPKLKIIIGFNNKEGILWAATYNESGLENINENFEHILPNNIIFNNNQEKIKLAEKVKRFYFANGIVNNSGDGLVDFFTDSVIAYPETASYLKFLSINVTVYNYYFEIDSNRNTFKFQTSLQNKKGASHGDLLDYEFNSNETANITLTITDIKIINVITTVFTNFAKTGKPTVDGIIWHESKLNDIQFLDINSTVRMIPMPIHHRMKFWECIYNTHQAY